MSRDAETGAPTPTYTMGYGPEFQKMLERRNAADCAAHLLPHLEPGMRLLDLGCGPGTISVGPGGCRRAWRAARHRHGGLADRDGRRGRQGRRGMAMRSFKPGMRPIFPSMMRPSTRRTATPCSTMPPTRRPCSPR